ncbi:MAG: ATP-binding cassette domain-containing protein [Kiritimatiellae bacterium]|nr:ATP-binding cassette domain-containing protein [Kiritimatiellia bacterium]
MIEVKDVVKSFDGNVVLNHVSTEMRDGEVNMIIGQSGSGKTVLMKSLIGLHDVDSGHILYDGRDLAQMKSKDIRMLHREVGMLFQGSALFDSMSVIPPASRCGTFCRSLPLLLSSGGQRRVLSHFSSDIG